MTFFAFHVYNPGKKSWNTFVSITQKLSPSPPLQCWSTLVTSGACHGVPTLNDGGRGREHITNNVLLNVEKLEPCLEFKEKICTHFSQSVLSVPTTFCQDCIRETQKKSSEFTFSLITQERNVVLYSYFTQLERGI